MDKIQQSHVAKLVTILRSDKYTQGFTTLRKDDCFCILGVMCDVSELGKWKYYRSGIYEYILNGDEYGATSYLSDSLEEHYGINRKGTLHEMPVLDRTGHIPVLHILNDKKELTFPQFADLLEWLYLFDYVPGETVNA